jgi:phosphate transport system permease protein
MAQAAPVKIKHSVRRVAESVIERIIQVAGFLAVVFVLLILVFLLRESLPIFKDYSLGKLLAGRDWRPTSDPALFGMLPLILGSIFVTVGAMVVSVPLGVGCAVFVAEIASPRMKEILKPLIEMLAAIPSVVYGFLGLLLLGPWLAKILDLPIGQFGMVGAILLAFIAIPTIVSVCEDALSAVPRAFRENSLALGATRWQTIARVTIPAARSGLFAAVLLGLGRAIGETMTVLMVTGNSPVIPEGLKAFLKPLATMTAIIAQQMGETVYGSDHYHALFMLGLLLFLASLAVSIISDVVIRRMPGVRA